jgi:hypothetical protein
MYACVYVYVGVYVSVYVYVCVGVYVGVCVGVYVCVYVCLCVYVCRLLAVHSQAGGGACLAYSLAYSSCEYGIFRVRYRIRT